MIRQLQIDLTVIGPDGSAYGTHTETFQTVGPGVGFGGIAGPLLFGMPLGRYAPAGAFHAAAVPMLFAAGAVALIGWPYRAPR